jgi:hypothetical protein
MHHIRLMVTTLLVAAGCAAACGGKSPTGPTGPSDTSAQTPSPGPAPVSATSLAGTVLSGNGAGVVTMGVPLAGVTVTIVGTTLTTSADGAGHFALKGIPAGDVEVQFTGGSAGARVRLRDVSDREQIQITVTISGSSADVSKEHRVKGSEAQLEGRITSVSPSSRAFEIEDVHVSVPGGATIRYGSRTLELSELQVGDRIHAAGSKDGSAVTAREVELEHPEIEPAEMTGGISGLSGACPARTFRLGSTIVTTASTTTFLRGTCLDLANGGRVEVRGIPAGGGLTATVVKFEDAGEAENEAEVEGALAALSGNCPTISFTVQGRTVRTSTATEFRDGACTALANGKAVNAKGAAQPDGSLQATRVTLK